MKHRNGSLRVAVCTLAVLGSMLCTSGLHAAVFAKYDGIDGEAQDAKHKEWIDVLSIDWGAAQAGRATGASRRRGGAVVEDMTMTIDYEKAAPKLQEKCLMGEVIPKLEIDMTAAYGGAQATYLKYELKNVMITSYRISAAADERPRVELSVSFQEMRVQYNVLDSRGRSQGTSETTWKVATGLR